MANSAFQKGTVISSANVTTAFVTDNFNLGGSDFNARIYYKKIGKMYFGFNSTVDETANVRGVIFGGMTDEVARLATLIGITVDDYYTILTSLTAGQNTGYKVQYSVANTQWQDNGGGVTTILVAIIST